MVNIVLSDASLSECREHCYQQYCSHLLPRMNSMTVYVLCDSDRMTKLSYEAWAYLVHLQGRTADVLNLKNTGTASFINLCLNELESFGCSQSNLNRIILLLKSWDARREIIDIWISINYDVSSVRIELVLHCDFWIFDAIVTWMIITFLAIRIDVSKLKDTGTVSFINFCLNELESFGCCESSLNRMILLLKSRDARREICHPCILSRTSQTSIFFSSRNVPVKIRWMYLYTWEYLQWMCLWIKEVLTPSARYIFSGTNVEIIIVSYTILRNQSGETWLCAVLE